MEVIICRNQRFCISYSDLNYKNKPPFSTSFNLWVCVALPFIFLPFSSPGPLSAAHWRGREPRLQQETRYLKMRRRRRGGAETRLSRIRLRAARTAGESTEAPQIKTSAQHRQRLKACRSLRHVAFWKSFLSWCDDLSMLQQAASSQTCRKVFCRCLSGMSPECEMEILALPPEAAANSLLPNDACGGGASRLSALKEHDNTTLLTGSECSLSLSQVPMCLW